MSKISSILLFFTTAILFSCSNRMDCEELPNSYLSYELANKTIRTAHFKIEETVNTSSSSWILDASYYSCDGITGFFILKTKNQEYIYSEVPIEIWQGFNNSYSYGNFYDDNIKHKFYFKLNK